MRVSILELSKSICYLNINRKTRQTYFEILFQLTLLFLLLLLKFTGKEDLREREKKNYKYCKNFFYLCDFRLSLLLLLELRKII